ncbi:hypothetical protein [Paenibacillus agilis]|uniref:Uncharacterized protein n=1 Tax=Paenibacillus agilis TaxID=3020863 RepID=A0A559IEF9_9BACL|nr:hypothetical protein [Paenibacillus agilis]TVX86047.1 hypothetical protein FPZ44_24200 [Paenibacillus agilis]
MQKELTFTKHTHEEAKSKELPVWNGCNHYEVDMSHLQSSTEDYMNTIVVKLPNGNAITMCVMQTSKDETCIDTAFHGDNIEKHRVYAMGGEGKDENVYNKNIYALIAKAKEIK